MWFWVGLGGFLIVMHIFNEWEDGAFESYG